MPWYRRTFEFPEYVSVAERRARAQEVAEKIARKQKRSLSPVGPIKGNKMVGTFWGKAWCDNLESYSDYASRLPRGRSYTRHGAVIDLQITAGKIAALVNGSSTYTVTVAIGALPANSWDQLASECTGHIDSLVDLLRGTLPARVLELVTRKDGGLFPSPKHISFECSCPDWAGMCKHVAATLYGVGVRLDEKPELFFELRGVDHTQLVGSAADVAPGLTSKGKGRAGRKVLEGANLSALFGIELEPPAPPPPAPTASRAGSQSAAPGAGPARRSPSAKKTKATKPDTTSGPVKRAPSRTTVAKPRGRERPVG